jgi:23S rRNA maturation-related 3'-5' exoribonuclease YhaM
MNLEGETMKNSGLKNTRVGEVFEGYVIMGKIVVKYKKAGKPYILLELSGKTDKSKAILWDRIDEYRKVFQTGTLVKLRGTIRIFMGRNELITKKIKFVEKIEADFFNINLHIGF